MTSLIHWNGLKALQLELDKTACKNTDDIHAVKRSQDLFISYAASHIARLKTEQPETVFIMDILTKSIATECGPAVTQAFQQHLLVFCLAFEFSKNLPEPKTVLEHLSAEQMQEIIARVSKI